MSDSEETGTEVFPLAKSKESEDSSFNGESDRDSQSSFEEEPKARKKPRLTPSKGKPPSDRSPKTIEEPPVTEGEGSNSKKKPPHTPPMKKSPKVRSTPKRTEPLDGRKYEIVLPATSEKILLIQLDDPNHSLDGATGAIGRIEATRESVVLDLQGQQYVGKLVPGPTVLLLGKHSEENTLKVEGMTSDFLQTEVVESNIEINPQDFFHQEHNVNRRQPSEQIQTKARSSSTKQGKKKHK